MVEATTALDAAYRALTWVGYGGLAGALAVLLVVWPEGVRQRRLALVAIGGAGLASLAALGWVVARLVLGDDPVLPRVEGAAAIARLAVLAAVGGFLTDLLGGPVRGLRRSGAAVALLTLTGTVLAGAAGGLPGQGAVAFTGDVVTAIVAVVCGACVVVAAVVLPGDARAEVAQLRVRVGETAPGALGAAALAGAVHAIAVQRSPWPVTDPWAVVLLALLVLAGGSVLGVRWLLTAAGVDAPQDVAPAGGDPPTDAVVWFEPVQVGRRPAVEAYEDPRRTATVAATTGPAKDRPPRTVVLPDTAAAEVGATEVVPAGAGTAPPSARQRRTPTHGQRARRVAGLGRLVLPDADDQATPTRTVRVAGAAEPVVVEPSGERHHSARRG